MPLAEKNFFSGTEYRRYKFDDPKIQAIADKNPPVKIATFTYESAKKVYTVEIRLSDLQKTYRINFGVNESVPNIYHKAIEKFFGLTEEYQFADFDRAEDQYDG